MSSIADESIVKHLGEHLAKDIVIRANNSKKNGDWTRAVYESLKAYGNERGWKIYPEDRCYAGEYLCDFTLFDEQYGCRIACESQWCNWRNHQHQDVLEWAFDKLRGVKSDIKVFIFEGAESEWNTVCQKYLTGYAQLSKDEAFLALSWNDKDKTFMRSWWQPGNNGLQSSPIQFKSF